MSQIFRQRLQPSRKNNDDDLIPLIDIVFLLLIFFMIAGKLHQPLISDPQLPEAAENPDQQSNYDKLRLELTADALYINGQISDQQQLLQRIQALPADEKVLLHADRELTTIHLNPLLATLRKAGREHLEIVTESQRVLP